MVKKRYVLKRWVIVLFIVICFVGIIFSGFHLFIWMKDISQNHEIKKQTDQYIAFKIDDEKIKYDIDFQTLKKQNKDTIGYLKVNGTNIDYVVVKGEDNSYYLTHNFNHDENREGWIFADYRNLLDGSDRNLIIYGHNTNDGSMFGSLKNVLYEDWYLNQNNHMIDFVTESGTISYQVFSVYRVYKEDYYIQTEFEEGFYKDFLQTLLNRSFYDFGVNLTEEDSILTLSSCAENSSMRVVLHAKKVA